MIGAVDLDDGPDLRSRADLYQDAVEEDAAEIEEHAVAEANVVAIVAMEGRPHHDARADMAEALAE